MKTLVILPTFNEAETLASVVKRIRKSVPEVSILVVDDASPDGTGRLADSLAETDPYISVLHRTKKDGLGSAYKDAFVWAQKKKFDVVIEHDADGSHQPEEIPLLMKAIEQGADAVIGARWIPGGSVPGWPKFRQLISKTGTFLARFLLRSNLHDLTSGFRAIRVSAFDSIALSEVLTNGYGFQIETAWLLERAGLRVDEVPITFTKRAGGESKMSLKIVVEALAMLFRLRLKKTRQPLPQVLP